MPKSAWAWRTALAVLSFCLPAGLLATAKTGARPAPPAAETGGIAGSVFYRGPKPQLRPIPMAKDPVCASLHSHPLYPWDGAVNGNGTLPNAFVYVEQSTATLPSTAPASPVVITQKGCEYDPHVMGVMVGQPFEVITLDPTTHNIHVMAKINREMDVSQQPGAPSVVWRFKSPEVMIPVRCNVHPWMKAYVGVVKNPFYAVTGAAGSFTLQGLPPGEYTVAVWTALFGTEQRRVTVRAGETAEANFTFTHTAAP